MSVSSACRDISELHPVAQAACRLFLSECAKAGVKIFLTETYRSQARQNYLYEQGRTRPGNKVTWTRNSNHTGRMAWDIAVNPPADLYDTATLNKAGVIAKRLGITWGGDWKGTIDRPHFEVKTTWKAPALPKPPVAPTPPKKEIDEMAQLLPDTQKKDMKKLLTNAYNTKDEKGNRIFSVDHSSKVDTMTRGQATDLLISYAARTSG